LGIAFANRPEPQGRGGLVFAAGACDGAFPAAIGSAASANPSRGQIVTQVEPVAPAITYEDFRKTDIRVGTIVEAEAFPQARRPAYKLKVDFGEEIGMRRTSVQIVANYRPEELIGRQVAAVINFPPKQIGPFMSEVLVLGFGDKAGNVTLIRPDKPVPNGGRLY
jgi:tRNA-binding protein